MRQTTSRYNPFPVVRDVDILLSFKVTDQNAKKDSTEVSTNTGWMLGGIRGMINDRAEPSGKYTSLERDLWVLDGTYQVLPDNAQNLETGAWSNVISGEDGTFTDAPWIRFDFDTPISTLGWTLIFDRLADQYASRVLVTCYGSDGAVLDAWETEADTAVQMHQHYVGDYYGVRFDFLRTSAPLRRIRLVEVDFGLTKYYNRNSLGTVRIVYGADLLGESFPARELVFSFDNSDKQYNLLNPDGVYQYLQDGQIITAQAVIGGEAVSLGEFRFTRADVSKSAIVPEITAHDMAYAFDNGTFDGGRAEDVTLSAAIAEVLDGFDIAVRYEGGSEGRMVSMTVPQNTKIRRAVQYLAQAAMVCPYIDRDGVLVFADFAVKAAEDGKITADELYDYTGVSIADPVHGVRLTVQDDYRIGADGSPGRQVNYYAGSQDVAAAQALFGNPCVADSAGQAVAEWLLARSRMRKRYDVKNRCDPAVEIGDTLRIDDIFNNRENAVITGIELEYDGTLSAKTKGVGV